MTKRYFTVAEANQVVPLLEDTFGRVLRLRSQVHAAWELLHELGDDVSPDDLAAPEAPDAPDAPNTIGEALPFEIAAARARARGLVETLREELRAIESLGVEVKDLDVGLCDFLARHGGRDVYLCWKLGEKRVTWWHELHTGFAGRKPLASAPERLLH
jgi:hypothetical protein